MSAEPRAWPLAGVRVLEWAEGIAGPTAGWLLAECGADVIKVEQPPGDPLRDALGFHVLNSGKRGLVLDLDDEERRERFRRLAAVADVVIVDEVEAQIERAELGYDAARWPSLIWCAVPAFPRHREWAGLPPDDALVEAAGGLAAMQWSYGATPVCFVTPMTSYAAGFVAALGIAAALRARSAGGRGQRIDTSGLAAAMLLQSGTYVRGEGHAGSLAGLASDPRGVFPTYGLYQTADGWMFVGALTEAFWTTLATLLERTDLLVDPSLPQNPLAMGRREVRERLRAELEPIFRSQTTGEWLRRFAEHDVPAGAVQSRREALAEPAASLGGIVIEIDDPELGPIRQPGAPVEFAGARARVPTPAPRLDRDAAPRFTAHRAAVARASGRVTAPLGGIRVLDLTSFIAGPLCPMLLADLGAEVVKIESTSGDPFRVATYGFEGWNRGKRSVVLDLKRDRGSKAFLRLVESADVVVENFRPAVMPALGLGYETLKTINPRLVYTAISGFGPDGPEAARPGFDPILQARSGLCRAQGGDGAEDEPVLHQVAYTDYMTGTLAAFATVAAVYEREHSGVGRRVDASLYRTSFAMQAAELVECAGRMPAVRGARDRIGTSAFERAYATRDGWVFVAAHEPRAASTLLSVLEIETSPRRGAEDDGSNGAVAQRIAAAVAASSSESLLARLAAAGIAATPCLTFDDVLTSGALRRCGLICDVEHPALGTLSETGPFLRFSQTPCVAPRPAPALGEATAEILSRAGLSRVEIEALSAPAADRNACVAT